MQERYSEFAQSGGRGARSKIREVAARRQACARDFAFGLLVGFRKIIFSWPVGLRASEPGSTTWNFLPFRRNLAATRPDRFSSWRDPSGSCRLYTVWNSMALIAQKHGIGGRFARCEAPVRLIALSGDEAAAVARVLRHGENLQQFARAARRGDRATRRGGTAAAAHRPARANRLRKRKAPAADAQGQGGIHTSGLRRYAAPFSRATGGLRGCSP